MHVHYIAPSVNQNALYAGPLCIKFLGFGSACIWMLIDELKKASERILSFDYGKNIVL